MTRKSRVSFQNFQTMCREPPNHLVGMLRFESCAHYSASARARQEVKPQGVSMFSCSGRRGLHRFTELLLPMTTMGKRWCRKKTAHASGNTSGMTPPPSLSVDGAARRHSLERASPPTSYRESRTGGSEMERQHDGRAEDFSTTAVPQLLHHMSNRWQERVFVYTKSLKHLKNDPF